MYTETYKTRSGAVQHRPVFESTSELMENDTAGLCLACGAEAYGVEPDASRYTCEICRAPKVCGFEELALMGLARFEMDEEDGF